MRVQRRKFGIFTQGFFALKGQAPRFLEPAEVRAALAAEGLKSWTYDQTAHTLLRKTDFEDFARAMSFINSFADYQRRIDHYCRVRNVGAMVELDLAAFSLWGVADIHFYLARAADVLIDKCTRGRPQMRTVFPLAQEELAGRAAN